MAHVVAVPASQVDVVNVIPGGKGPLQAPHKCTAACPRLQQSFGCEACHWLHWVTRQS